MTCDDRHRCRARYCFLPRLSHGGARLNSGEVKPAQSGEQMAPDNFIPSLPILLGANVPLTSSNARTPLSHSQHHPLEPPTPNHPWNPRPGNHSVVAAISGICLSSTCLPPFPASLISVSPPKCISAWQTTWDFSSPLKSAASGKHSSPCNILVFKGIRDWGGNQPGNLFYSLCLLLVANSVDVFQGGWGVVVLVGLLFFFFPFLWS